MRSWCAASIQALVEWNECVASLRVGDEVAWQRELPLSTSVMFTHNINVTLFIDDGGRRLDLPSAAPTATASQADGSVPGDKQRVTEIGQAFDKQQQEGAGDSRDKHGQGDGAEVQPVEMAKLLQFLVA